MKILRNVIPLTLLLLLPLTGRATTGYFFHTLKANDGLADNFVRNVVRDNRGYIWISTINGLSRYDGYRFRNYNPQQYGASTNDVTYVGQTADSTLWMVSSGSLYTLDSTQTAWHNDGAARLARLGIKGDMHTFYTDDRHNLWVATSAGLYYYNYTTLRLAHITHHPSPIAHIAAPITHIAAREGTVCVVTADHHIYKVEMGERRLTPLAQVPNASYSRDPRVYLDSHEHLWVYNSHSPAGSQWCFSLRSHKWRLMDEWRLMGQASVNAITEDHEGNLWVGTGNEGVFVFSLQDGLPTRLLSRMDAFATSNSHISCLYLDDNNVMWIGSAKLGVAFAYMEAPDFDVVSTKPYEDVSTVAKDREGNLWMGFDGDGVLLMAADGSTTHFSEAGRRLPSDIVTSIAIAPDGAVLVGTYGSGMARYDGRQFVGYHTDNPALKYVKGMTADGYGNLWVATVDRGVVRIAADGTSRQYTAENSTLPYNGVTCIAADPSGDMVYIGTSRGVAAYDCRRGRFSLQKAFDRLKGNYVSSIVTGHDGTLWIGSHDGLWACNMADGRMERLTTTHGMSHNTVRALAAVWHGVWASTDNGLTLVKTTSQAQQAADWQQQAGDSIRQYTCYPLYGPDGLHDIIFSNNAAMTSPEGDAIMGCNSGYIRVRPEDVVVHRHKSQVEFTDLHVNGKPLPAVPREVTIGHGQRLSVFLSAMLPAQSHKMQYFYRFQGQKQWTPIQGNMLYLTELSSGSHLLEVKAVMAGIMQSETAVLPITVRQPRWLSTPALLAYVLLLLGGGLLAYRLLRVRRRRVELVKTMEITPSTVTVNSLDEEFVSNAIAHVEANMSNSDYSIAQLSSDVGMTRGHLYKKLMAITGKSPLEFVRIIKLKRGRSLLEQGKTNISEVADMVGMSPKQFTHYFVRMYEETPSDFVKRNRRKDAATSLTDNS